MQQVQVLIDRALTELGLEIDSRLVTLELAVVIQPVWTELVDISVDVFGGLLAPNIKGAAEVVGGQAPLPLQNYLQQTKTQRLILGQNFLAYSLSLPICSKR